MLTFMKVAQPKSLEEAYDLFIKNKTAPLLAGGCWLRLASRRWPMVIDMSQLGLNYIKEENGEFVIGAMATQGQVENYPGLRSFTRGILPKAVHEILGVQFRNMATIGGSVASKYGFSDIIPTLLAMHTDVVLFHTGRMSLEEYCKTSVRDILVEIRIPQVEVPIAVETLRNSRGDFPYLTGSIRKDDDGYALYIGTRPGVAKKAEKASTLLTEKGSEALQEAANIATQELVYQSNTRASKEYRQALVKGMVKRLVMEVDTWK